MLLPILTAISNGCGVSYQRIVEIIADASPFGHRTTIAPKQPILERKREEDSENDDEPRHFRRVRIKCRERARNQNGQRSPPLVPQVVNLKPSPSPDYLPSPENSPTPERLSRSSSLNSREKNRRPKAQPSQGDLVLIDFMGGLGYPDLATKAGEVPLPHFDDSDVDDPMDVDGREQSDSYLTLFSHAFV